ncbi:hypothetical protein [Peribacillus glennii]|uniref:Uncharacterized protein n=1 Tax=Peribacillus glennii TaxID=2303991 RepID=A0A372LH14_9BACI|nr:hypothetical protein [Peribacillus glennii]RFU65587.1 hypothetical protein D0466_06835 [Peribacillus glennii]
MIIKECKGYELEKAQSNSPEDFFNRSLVTYIEDGEEKTFHVLYVRYFDEFINEFTSYSGNPLFSAAGREIFLYDIAALVCLLKNPGFRSRKRVFINTKEEFTSYFSGLDLRKLPEVFESLGQLKEYRLDPGVSFIN